MTEVINFPVEQAKAIPEVQGQGIVINFISKEQQIRNQNQSILSLKSSVTQEDLESIMRKIDSGFYNSAEAIQIVAEKIMGQL